MQHPRPQPDPRRADLAAAPRSAPRTRYRLGAPISLSDLLALPPDGNRYSRDEKGRLILTPPDSAVRHRTPLSILTGALFKQVDEAQFFVVQEGGVAFDPIYKQDGTILPPSFQGLPTIEPDLMCLRQPVRTVQVSRDNTAYSPEGVALVVELLSPSTWRRDLGDGEADDVDKWRTYLECGVPEYWVVNATDRACGIPARSCLVLARDPAVGTWADLPADDVRYAPGDYRGRRCLVAGRVHSLSVPGLVFDIDRLWRTAKIDEEGP